MNQFSLKRIILITPLAALLLLMSDRRMDAGQFGPPEAGTPEGKIALGVGYFRFAGKLNPENGNLLARRHELKQNQIYLQASYGFLKNWETYLRVVASDLKINNAFPFAEQRGLSDAFKDGFRPSGALGIKGLVYDSAYFSLGPFFQMNISSGYKDKKRFDGNLPACDLNPEGVCLPVVAERSDELKVKNLWDVNLGIDLQTKIYGITLYAGPFAYWTGYKAEYKLKVFNFPPNSTITDQTHYREKNNFGGFVGLKAPLPWVKGLNVDIEGQFRNKGSVGISLSYLLW